MPKTKLIKPRVESSPNGRELASDLHQLLLLSVQSRDPCGATYDIQSACLRGCKDEDALSDALPDDFGAADPDCSCDADKGEVCDLCDEDRLSICTTDEVRGRMKNRSMFTGVAKMFATIKAYDYVALAEHAYAAIGNKPFQLKSNKDIDITDNQTEEVSVVLEETIQQYIDANDIKVDEIPQAFNFATVSEMVEAWEGHLKQEVKEQNDEALAESEDVLERVFNRAEFMQTYLEAIKDTTDHPIGVVWVDDNTIKKTHKIVGPGKVKVDNKIQSNIERVDPKDFWVTPDHTLYKFGRSVFRLKRFTYGDIQRWADLDVSGSTKLNTNIKSFLSEYDSGGTIPFTMLFQHYNPLVEIDYDVIIARGYYKADHVRDLGVTIPDHLKNEMYVPCEAYFSGSYVLRLKVLETTDPNLGVHTTLFRRNGDSVFGYSVYDFTFPFANFYETLMDKIDRAAGKALGMFVQIDTGVIDNPEKYFHRDDDGNITMDLSEDQLIEFDSTEAFGAPNFRGMPIHVTQMPSNLDKLLPLLNLILQEMERITGIPTMLTDGGDISSALRTTSNFNRAFAASNKIVKALLRESETRILKPSIKNVFEIELLNGRLPKELIDLDPEILLSDQLTTEFNDDREMVNDLSIISQFRDLIPPERFAALVNSVAKEAWGISDELVEGAGFLNLSKPAQTVAQA